MICEALAERHYNPVWQLAGYILTQDPTMITRYKDARRMITQLGYREVVGYVYDVDTEMHIEIRKIIGGKR